MPSLRTAIVTGGTRGIGCAISLALAREGYLVTAAYRNREVEAVAFQHKLAEVSTGSAVFRADVSQAEEAASLVAFVLDRHGQVDVLVNNVGPWMYKQIIDTSPEEWRVALEGNLSSAFYCIRAALPSMRERRQGCIINIGAMNSEIFPSGDPYSPVFGVGKAGAMLMVRNLAYSEGPFNIRVNAVSPGLIQTPEYVNIPAGELQEQIGRIALRRLGKPEDIAEAVAYLVSDRAAYVTGTILHVHGGLFRT